MCRESRCVGRSLKVYIVTVTVTFGPNHCLYKKKRQSHQSAKLYWSSALFPS